ncbi:hypothetical protein XM38_037940 [Halomicronema hongdechloris C2206]|uniref:DUF4359 domain-containing protein n=1 Tax=Halomicronema hongdechloris C2206 TaxID=1641165 RepID=A0A1Z3HR89_9CYAN|nr:DUF4359 domain-containing protein [Halomicronema hongdechloris]ASC72834.1 hypothetical protein XM38_037940 [Halomicronema hongdechloris C2206]
MGNFKVGTWLSGGVLLAAAALLFVTNPDQSTYETYAVKRLSTYAKEELCHDLPGTIEQFLSESCESLIDENQQSVQDVIRQSTVTLNFGLFSLYRTRLAVPGVDVLPTYEVETLGIFNRFYTYRAEQQ